MLTVAELHAASTHLALVALPLWAVLVVVRRLRPAWPVVAGAEPWVLGGAVVGMGLAGLTGLLVRGQAETVLRGRHLGVGTIHFWLGIALAAVVVVIATGRIAVARGARGARVPLGPTALGAAVVLVGAVAQGYLGGRMTYRRAVGIDAGGELARSAAGARELEVAVAQGVSPVRAGEEAFSEGGLGCASCHGVRAQGARGPRLAGGKGLDEFRRVHGDGLFPAAVVTDRDFAVIDRYLKSLGRPGEGEGR